ncbi:MAG: Hsp20/alpha crystallin family protein [Deltaproteobacteria bacterium]|nr:Hsp20/alpha crystallin family protein [Deltaproteobacteria bacterium]MBW1927550.1 Hsp20/alpha crystallin family protein [Deltaproteobacteria bacterium]MBW2026524.1 Hsp20/alpha crystallin family protein [Deltaproteobacteria bacterium]MBW2124815.1 Hsp20/alpha crystallin family protein [Deltaproteobacteria bacterium]RLB13152.1 MAG: Hsp20/alpha crystallin family protein [Deltaproteobacteria bacterium]
MTLLDLIPFTNEFLGAEELMEEIWPDLNIDRTPSTGWQWSPAFDLAETEKEYIIKAEVPGVDPKDMKITFSNGVLWVRGEKKPEAKDEERYLHRQERWFGSFERAFRFAEEVAGDKIEAIYRNGVLTLHLPKAQNGQVRKIKVK